MIILTIIIPHYNSAESLGKLLNSIPNRDEIEVIVVDDKSTKNGLEEVVSKSYLKNLILFKNTTSIKGAGVCRNIGLRNAKGKWILFADSDDYFIDGFYAVIEKYFLSNNEVVFFSPTSIEVDTNKLSNRHIIYEKLINDYINNKNWKTETNLRYKFYVPWSKLICRDFLIKNNIFFDEVIASNDINFSTKVGHYMTSFDLSNEVIYCVTKNKGSLTVNRNLEVFNSRLDVYIEYVKFLKQKLTKAQFKYLDLRGTGFLVNVLKYHLGIKMLFKTIRKLRKEKIKIFDYRFLNPVFLFKRVVRQIKINKYNKNYYS